MTFAGNAAEFCGSSAGKVESFPCAPSLVSGRRDFHHVRFSDDDSAAPCTHSQIDFFDHGVGSHLRREPGRFRRDTERILAARGVNQNEGYGVRIAVRIFECVFVRQMRIQEGHHSSSGFASLLLPLLKLPLSSEPFPFAARELHERYCTQWLKFAECIPRRQQR